MKQVWIKRTLLLLLTTGGAAIAPHQSFAQTTQNATTAMNAANAGLKLPAGFSAAIVAPKVGSARHLAVTSNGDIYVKLQNTGKDEDN